jgi:hypothetical protein
MNHWKWSKGEPYYKSARPERQEKETNDQLNNSNLEYDSQKNAINQSLAEDLFTNSDNELLSITNSMFSRNQNAQGTRREDLDVKMADRELVTQRGVNPFLQTSYVNDIVTRDMFLKPINTTQGRTKNTNSDTNETTNNEYCNS